MKKLISVMALVLLTGALLTGCGNGDGNVTSSSGSLSVPSPGEMISNTESAVENMVSDIMPGNSSSSTSSTNSSSDASSR